MNRSSKHSSESAFTLVEILIVIMVLSILSSIAVLSYIKQREKSIDATVKSDVRAVSTFMKEDYLKNDIYPQEIPEAFTNWSRENLLELKKEGSCIEGTTPEYDSIFWRYSLVDNEVSQEPCPDPLPEDIREPDPDPDRTPDPGDPPPPPPPGDEDEDPDYNPAKIIRVEPILFTGFNNQSTNNLNLLDNGDLMVDGDFHCNSNVEVSGTVVVTGEAYLTNNCVIKGDLWVGEDLIMDSSPHVLGDVLVKGDISTQSTATIDGDVWTTGELTSNDGRSVEELQDSGSIGGEVETGVHVPKYKADEFPVNKVNGSLISWSNWLKQQASYSPGTPEWSPIPKGEGCTVSPGTNWSLDGDIQVKEPTNVDARGCDNIEIGAGGTIQLEADLTLFVNSFRATNGIHFKSKDGQQHDVNIIVPTKGQIPQRTCSGIGSIDLGTGSTGDDNVRLTTYTESKTIINGTSTFTGEIVTGCSHITGSVNIKRLGE